MKLLQAVISRRRALAGLAALGAPGALLPALSHAASLTAGTEAAPAVTVHRDPSCGCCGSWVEHLRRAGFPVTVIETRSVDAVKERLGVPDALASCHTAEVQGYVIEGHVPAAAIRRLLAERPQAIGLAVPGMPVGSPGMEGGTPETYDVVLFGPQLGTPQRRTFARFHGDQEL